MKLTRSLFELGRNFGEGISFVSTDDDKIFHYCAACLHTATVGIGANVNDAVEDWDWLADRKLVFVLVAVCLVAGHKIARGVRGFNIEMAG